MRNSIESQVARTATHEEKMKADLIDLQSDVDDLRAKLNKKFTGDVWKVLEGKSTKLLDLKKRLKHEQQLKKNSLKNFLDHSFGTAEDHERLWETTLRDEAMRKDMETKGNLERIRSHSIYRTF